MFKKLLKEIKNKIVEYRYLLIALITILLICTIELPYYIHVPGGLINIEDKIDSNIKTELSGSMNMAYVSEIKATIPTYLYSKLNSNWDLEKISEVVYSNETVEEQEYRNKMLLKEANSTATIVAYKKANKTINIKDKNIYIIYIDEKTSTNLKIKDQIIKIDNKIVDNLIDIKKIINQHDVNDIIKIETNNGIKTAKIYKEKSEKLIGIIVATEYELDSDIKFTFSNSESGSSGGLMMTLSIYNYLTLDSLSKGRKIVGTGTINLDGTVGEIDGIKYKLIGAVNNNADLLLVPSKNYDEAIKIKEQNNYSIPIYPVNTVEEAIEYLKKNS